MHYGLTLPNMGIYSDVRMLADLASQAEEAGWDGFFLWDTLNYDADNAPVCDTWVALAAVAMQTKRIKIGTMVATPTRRRPWKMARETVTLDHLSNGRLILAVGAGDVGDKGFTHFGEEMDAKKRARLLDESLEVLQGLWSGKPFSHDGEHYSIKEVTFLPVPVQTPRIPIWVAGVWPRKGPMTRAARWDGVNPVTLADSGGLGQITPVQLQDLKVFMDEHRTSNAPFDIVVSGPVFDASSDEQAKATIRAYADAGATWCLASVWPEKDLDGLRASIQQGPPRLQ